MSKNKTYRKYLYNKYLESEDKNEFLFYLHNEIGYKRYYLQNYEYHSKHYRTIKKHSKRDIKFYLKTLKYIEQKEKENEC